MLPKQGKVHTGEIVSKETMAQILANAGQSALEAGRQRHAHQVAIAQQMQKINAPLAALVKQDEATLQAARDLQAMIIQSENQNSVFPNTPRHFAPLNIPFPLPTGGSNSYLFTPSSYSEPRTEGDGYANAANGEFGFKLSSISQGYLDAMAGLGVAEYQAIFDDYQLLFSPLVQYSYDWNDTSLNNGLVTSSGTIEILINSTDTNGAFHTEFDQIVPFWNDKPFSAFPLGIHSNSNGGSLYYTNGPGGGGVHINLNVTPGWTYYFTLICHGAVEADGGSNAIAQLDIRVPFVVIQDYYRF